MNTQTHLIEFDKEAILDFHKVKLRPIVAQAKKLQEKQQFLDSHHAAY